MARAARASWAAWLPVLLLLLPAAGRPGNFQTCPYNTQLLEWPDWLNDWPGGCLTTRSASTDVECNATCLKDAHCPAWQFTTGGRCLWAKAACSEEEREQWARENRTGDMGGVAAGGLVQHGNAEVLHRVGPGTEVRGLHDVGGLGADSIYEGARRCHLICYADISCGFWQFREDRCWVELGPTPVTQKNISKSSALGRLTVDGEMVVRGCPHDPHPGWIIMGLLNFSLGLSAAIWAVTGGEGPTRNDPLKPNLCMRSLMFVRSSTLSSWSDGSDSDSSSEDGSPHDAFVGDGEVLDTVAARPHARPARGSP